MLRTYTNIHYFAHIPTYICATGPVRHFWINRRRHSDHGQMKQGSACVSWPHHPPIHQLHVLCQMSTGRGRGRSQPTNHQPMGEKRAWHHRDSEREREGKQGNVPVLFDANRPAIGVYPFYSLPSSNVIFWGNMTNTLVVNFPLKVFCLRV